MTITVLGSTGSIGVNTLDVVRQHGDRFKVHALVAGRNRVPSPAAGMTALVIVKAMAPRVYDGHFEGVNSNGP